MRQRLLPPGVKPRFTLGNIVMTAQAFKKLPVEDVSAAIGRHAECDWGNLCSPDWELMNEAVEKGGRIWSAHCDRNETTFWIITEADRSATTVLLPADY